MEKESSNRLESEKVYCRGIEVSHESESASSFSESREITVGCSLPFGPRMYHNTPDNVVRMKDIGVSKRILVLGVVGSFTPDCWNKHLFLVLKHHDYYKERRVDHICCISTNDSFVHAAWGTYLGCHDKILMWSDPRGKYVTALGMDTVVPWIDSRVRSKRFVLLADDMVVTKIIKTDRRTSLVRWDCDHLIHYSEGNESSEYDDTEVRAKAESSTDFGGEAKGQRRKYS